MKKTILVADHSEVYLKHIANILVRMGFDVLPMDKASYILKILKKKLVDLIIIDEDISKEHIVEILDWLKSNKQTATIPVVLISSNPHAEMETACKEHGCVNYIKKPISLNTLHAILQDNIYTPLGYHRKHMRANYNEKVSVIHNNESFEYTMESLSEGGVYMTTKSPLPVEAEVEVFLDLENNNLLSIKGTVIYTNTIESKKGSIPKGMAVEFADDGGNQIQVIKDFIQGLLTSDVYKPKESA